MPEPETSLPCAARWDAVVPLTPSTEPGRSRADGRRGEHVSPLENKQRKLGSCSVMPGVAGEGKKTSFSQLAPWKKSGVILCCICQVMR